LDIGDFKGAKLVPLAEDAPPKKVVAALFARTSLAGARVTSVTVLNSYWAITGSGTFLCVDVDTNLGRRFVKLQYDAPQIGGGALRGWWCWLEEPPSSLPDLPANRS
jgi:hypothetical protein